ncbi:MAG: DUF2933 domain-containing protein [Burkholderiales bacterium]|nr:DUF2933 domain-containing protein [Burkholderiales bacterium]
MSHEHQEHPPSFMKSPAGIALCVVGAVAAYFLITEHLAHVTSFLPFILLALCPLMHIFMHHGHGHSGHGDSHRAPPASDDKGPTP